jgi:hypothetical protein
MTNIALLFLTYDEIIHKKTLEWTTKYTTYINAKEPKKVLEYKHCRLYNIPTKWGHTSIVNASIQMLKDAFNDNHEYFMLLSYDVYPLISMNKFNQFFKYQKKSCFNLIQNMDDEWKTSQWWILNRNDANIILQYHEEYSKIISKEKFKIQAAYDEMYFLSLLKYYNPIYSFYEMKSIYVEWLKTPIQKHPTIFNCITDIDIPNIKNSFFIRKTLDTFTPEFTPKKMVTIKIIGDHSTSVNELPNDTDIIIISMIDVDEIKPIYKKKCIRIYTSLFSQLKQTLFDVIELISPYWETILVNDEKGKLNSFASISFSKEKVSLYGSDPIFYKHHDYYLYSPHKIAFLFLTIGDINQPEIWSEYFKNNWHKINVYIHPKFPKLVKTKWLKNNIISDLVPTEWGFITNAYYQLLKEALQNKDNIKFMFISESCIPLKSFDLFYKKMMKDHINTSYIKFMDINGYNKNVRIKSQPNYKELEPFVKHYARMCLSRYHSEKLIDCKKYDFFNKMHVGDEFFLTCIHPVKNKDYIQEFEITYDNWEYIDQMSDQYNYEIELLYDKIESGDNSNETKRELKRKQLLRDDLRKNPKTYTSITPSDIETVIQKESFFWRKFTNKKLPWTYSLLNFMPSTSLPSTINIEQPHLNFKPIVNSLFVHIPKTGGMSIFESVLNLDRSFGWFLGDPTKKGEDVELKPMKKSGGVMLGHISYKSALKEKILDEDFFNHSFKFCFVRNPYARLVSLYKYHKIKERLNLLFDEFVELLYDEYKKKTIPPIGLYNIKTFDKKSKLYHKEVSGNQYNQMIDWIPCNIGYIGRIENFDDDMNHILRVLGYRGPSYISPKINTTKEDDYSTYYKNKKTKQYASEIYRDDIQRFGYKL